MKTLIAAGLSLVMAPLAHAGSGGAHWTYEGEDGPAHWSELDHSFATCGAGHEQSPIDLNDSAIPAAVMPPAVYWHPAEVTAATNNGHTFQVSLNKPGKIVIDGVPYEFLQFHFHAGSEHTINGYRYPLEVHLVHAAADGRLAVIGIMFVEGKENPALSQLISTLPGTEGSYDPDMAFDLNDLLPGSWSVYRYAGSLTTPPCSEVVSWTVFEKPLTASSDQIKVFETLFPHSYRPVQPLGRRFVLKGS